jgi:IclR family KDG regulon transcriptional repressor
MEGQLMNKPAPAKAVVKTMRILEYLSHERSVGIIELTRRVSAHANDQQMNKSTVYRFLTSLKELGFVRQDPETERYSLTLKLFEMGMCVLDRLDLWREADPVLKQGRPFTSRRWTTRALCTSERLIPERPFVSQ